MGELVIPGAFIAFYPSRMIADRAASRVGHNVPLLGGSMVRRGNATVAIVGKPLTAAQHRKLLDCLQLGGRRNQTRRPSAVIIATATDGQRIVVPRNHPTSAGDRSDKQQLGRASRASPRSDDDATVRD